MTGWLYANSALSSKNTQVFPIISGFLKAAREKVPGEIRK
jgi:hypothetical protein